MNIENHLPRGPIQPGNRFWNPIRVWGHTVIPLSSFSEEPLHKAVKLPLDGNFDAITDEEISAWEETYANVGLLCGKPSGVTVLEVTTHSAQLWLAEQGLPVTPQWLSLRSRYYLFNHVGDVLPKQITELRAGLRVLNDGAHVIYPGSFDEDGGVVYWEASPDCVEVADFPEWLLPRRNVIQPR